MENVTRPGKEVEQEFSRLIFFGFDKDDIRRSLSYPAISKIKVSLCRGSYRGHTTDTYQEVASWVSEVIRIVRIYNIWLYRHLYLSVGKRFPGSPMEICYRYRITLAEQKRCLEMIIHKLEDLDEGPTFEQELERSLSALGKTLIVGQQEGEELQHQT